MRTNPGFLEHEPREPAILFDGKKKSVLLQASSGPEGSRKLRFPDFLTTAQAGGKFVTDRLYPQEMLPVLISVRG